MKVGQKNASVSLSTLRSFTNIFSAQNMALQTTVLRFKFANFANIPIGKKKEVASDDPIDCDGTKWRLELHVRGDSYCLSNKENRKIGSLVVRNEKGLVAYEKKDVNGRGFVNLQRSFIQNKANNVLVDGTLIVDIYIHARPDQNGYHVSPNPFAKNMLKLLESEDNADVSFKINDAIVRAHKLILRVNAPILANFCEGASGTPVLLKDTTAEVFRHVLNYVYGGSAPDKGVMTKLGKEIIDAADRFDVGGLKMAAEAVLVEQEVVDVSNVVDYILFAHSKTCPLLKEYAISYFTSRAKDVFASESSAKLKESAELMQDIILAMADLPNKLNGFEYTTVNQLRKMLHEEELDVDGPKEILVTRVGIQKLAKKRKRSSSSSSNSSSSDEDSD